MNPTIPGIISLYPLLPKKDCEAALQKHEDCCNPVWLPQLQFKGHLICMHVVAGITSGQLSLVSYMRNYTVSDYLIKFSCDWLP